MNVQVSVDDDESLVRSSACDPLGAALGVSNQNGMCWQYSRSLVFDLA